MLGHIEARAHTDTAVMFENTNDSSLENRHFEDIGGRAQGGVKDRRKQNELGPRRGSHVLGT